MNTIKYVKFYVIMYLLLHRSQSQIDIINI